MTRNRTQALKRRLALETLETRDVPAVMGPAAWAALLRTQVNAIGGASTAPSNPPSSNLTQQPDGSYAAPGTFFNGGEAMTNSLRTGGGANAIGTTNPPSSNLGQRPDGSIGAPGTFFNGGEALTNSLRTGFNTTVPTQPGGTLTSPTLPSSASFSSRFLRIGAATTGGGLGSVGSIGTGAGVTTPSTLTRFSSNFLRGGPVGGTIVTSPGTVTGGGVDLGGAGGGSVTTPGVTVPSTTLRFNSNFLRTGSPGSLATPGVTVPSVTTNPGLTDPTITTDPTSTGLNPGLTSGLTDPTIDPSVTLPGTTTPSLTDPTGTGFTF